mgnify:CR=1 FL=1
MDVEHVMRPLTDVWARSLFHLFEYGSAVAPRGQKTLELRLATVAFDSRFTVLENKARRLGYRFMAAEAAWILSGDDRVETIAPFSKAIASFSDDGEKFFGAYGPPLLRQWDYVKTKLREDENTRQAVINIWRDSPEPTKDTPCTLSYQFLLRHNQLHLSVAMRSSDVWLGLPYDAFNQAMILCAMALELSQTRYELLKTGSIAVSTGSLHLYERNFDGAREALKEAPGRRLDSAASSNFYVSVKQMRDCGVCDRASLADALWKVAKDEPAPGFFEKLRTHITGMENARASLVG